MDALGLKADDSLMAANAAFDPCPCRKPDPLTNVAESDDAAA